MVEPVTLPRVLWLGTHPIIEIERGRLRSHVIIRERGQVTAKFIAIEMVDRWYKTTFLDRPSSTPLAEAAQSLIRSARIKPKAHKLLQGIIMQFDDSITPSQIRAQLVTLAGGLPEGHKLASVPERFRDRAAAVARYNATEQAIEDAKNAPANAGDTATEAKQAEDQARYEAATEQAINGGDDNGAEVAGILQKATIDNNNEQQPEGAEEMATKKPARKRNPKAAGKAIAETINARRAAKKAPAKKAAKQPAKKAAKKSTRLADAAKKVPRKAAPPVKARPKNILEADRSGPGRKPAFADNARFVAIVSEDDVRLQDASRRTIVFRAIAAAKSRGATFRTLATETRLSDAEIRGCIRHLLGQERIEHTNPKS